MKKRFVRFVLQAFFLCMAVTRARVAGAHYHYTQHVM